MIKSSFFSVTELTGDDAKQMIRQMGKSSPRLKQMIENARKQKAKMEAQR